MARAGFRRDERAVDAVAAIVLTILIALVIAGVIRFVLTGIANDIGKAAPAAGRVTDQSGSSTKAWKTKVRAVNRESVIPDHMLAVHTPENGALVARPVGDTGSDSYWWSRAEMHAGGLTQRGTARGRTGGPIWATMMRTGMPGSMPGAGSSSSMTPMGPAATRRAWTTPSPKEISLST